MLARDMDKVGRATPCYYCEQVRASRGDRYYCDECWNEAKWGRSKKLQPYFSGKKGICLYPCCTKPCNIEHSKQYDYCGRTHGREHRFMIEADLRIRLAMHQQQRPQPPSSRSHQPRLSQQAHVQYYQQPHSALDSGRRQKWSAGATGGSRPIYFHNKDNPYYEFTNFYDGAPITLDGKTWPTTEHYFQAKKFIGTPYEASICLLPHPQQAFDLSRSLQVSRWQRTDWKAMKKDVMYKALLAKFAQHEDMATLLLGTGKRDLIEHTHDNSYWGDGGDGSGRNKLGKLLVRVRGKLRAGGRGKLPQLVLQRRYRAQSKTQCTPAQLAGLEPCADEGVLTVDQTPALDPTPSGGILVTTSDLGSTTNRGATPTASPGATPTRVPPTEGDLINLSTTPPTLHTPAQVVGMEPDCAVPSVPPIEGDLINGHPTLFTPTHMARMEPDFSDPIPAPSTESDRSPQTSPTLLMPMQMAGLESTFAGQDSVCPQAATDSGHGKVLTPPIAQQDMHRRVEIIPSQLQQMQLHEQQQQQQQQQQASQCQSHPSQQQKPSSDQSVQHTLMNAERDPRGIRRGSCKNCSCLRYTRIGFMKCSCGHVPGIHKNLDQSTRTAHTPTKAQSHDSVGSTRASHPATVAGGSTGERGRCMKCSCIGCTRTDSVKCSKCGHPPDVHENSNQPTQETTVQSCDPVGLTSYATVAGGPGDYVYGAGQSYAGENYGGQFSSPALPVTVPNCKADSCMNPAFYDPEVGMFDYCSPSCRDTHLLPKEKLKLQTDIHELEEQLRAVGVAQQRSQPTSSNVDPQYPSERNLTGLELVTMSTKSGDHLGIITSEKEYKGEKRGLLVTGVEMPSVAALYVKRGDLRLLDVIAQVNRQPYKKFLSGFSEDVVPFGDVTLHLSHSVALANPRELLIEAEKLPATHLFALMLPNTKKAGSIRDPLGLQCDTSDKAGVTVKYTFMGKPARQSGLKSGDIILLYTSATRDRMDPSMPAYDKNVFEDYVCSAVGSKKAVVLVVERFSSRITFI